VRHLGGFDLRYANIIELWQYSTFDEVCVLAHKVEKQRKTNPTEDTFLNPQPRVSLLIRGALSRP